MEFEFGHVPVLFGTSGACARDRLTLRGLPSAKGRSILKCLVPAGAARSVNVASLQPILNAGRRSDTVELGWCDDRRADAQRDKKRR
ncbi:hypothetical protein KTE49_20410 [Burkholderia multivorans]|uniref:hypothetical protein n=1 Tax=Burkholderia multivorans TaxID=87883 RepID=UPI0011B2196C|nr:hypothetical protein [Burkholderia multivorans]MBJ9617158.1 hypothetical protein [Burkholderia multivorans]MBU9329775.1 hypothetical protein [Burkholderia multivorans]MBU9532802.1 hypothetical protein [Burkholderia multivorans]